MSLPPGFKLEDSSQATSSSVKLPPGFELEEAAQPSWLDKAKQYGSQMGEVFKQQGKGALGSFGVDVRTPDEKQADSLSDSVMATPQQKAGSLSRKIGGYAGDMGNLIVSEFTAGVPAETLIAKYGAGPVMSLFTKGALTGATYAGIKGAEQNTPPKETVKSMGETGLGFGALNVAGYPISKAWEGLTKNVPEALANEYVNPSQKLAEKARLQSQPSYGRQFLDKTDYGIGQGKNEVFGDMQKEIGDNNMLIQNALDKRIEQTYLPKESTTITETVPEKGVPFLGTRERSEVTKTFTRQPKPGVTVTENIPERPLPYTGEGKTKGTLGETIRPEVPTYNVKPNEQVSPLNLGGFEREKYIPSQPKGLASDLSVPDAEPPITKTFITNKYVPTTPDVPPPTLGGFERTKKIGTGGTYERGLLGEPTRVSPLDTNVIDLNDVRSQLPKIISEQTDIGRADAAKAIADLSQEFAPGERVVDLKRADQLLTELDAEVNKAYLSDANSIPPGTEARQALANYLRDRISQMAPEVADLNSRQHFLLNTRNSLLSDPGVSGRSMFGKSGFESISNLMRYPLTSRASLGLARGLEFAGEEVPLNQAYKTGSRLGLSEYLKKKNQ